MEEGERFLSSEEIKLCIRKMKKVHFLDRVYSKTGTPEESIAFTEIEQWQTSKFACPLTNDHWKRR